MQMAITLKFGLNQQVSTISDDAISNAGYFEANDGLSEKTVYPNEVIPFMDKFKILMGDGTTCRRSHRVRT